MPYQKHLDILFHDKLNFKQHIDSAILKVKKGISATKKLRHNLPRKSLLTIYKAFWDRNIFVKKIESVQFKATSAIAGAIQGTSRDKIYQELGWKSLSQDDGIKV